MNSIEEPLRARGSVMMALLAVGAAACGGGDPAQVDADPSTIDGAAGPDAQADPDAQAGPDADGDGVLDADDPTPSGSDANQLRGTFTGGGAAVVAITGLDGKGVEDLTLPYQSDLTSDCSTSWYPQGALCDDPRAEPSDRDSKTHSAALTRDAGATWYNLDGIATGILVIDACADASCEAIDFDEARVFQMFSDGKTTHITLYASPATDSVAPAWDDASWEQIAEAEVGPGLLDDAEGLVVSDPTVIALDDTVVTRYLRVDVQNDGSQDDGSYIELRSLKLFGAPAI